jgi:hypothetical protein
MSQPNYIAEFNWPVGKEIPSDLRRLTVNEFYLAIQLAARSVREMKEPLPAVGGPRADPPTDYRDRYDQLLQHLNTFLQKNDTSLRQYIDKQIDEVTAEIAGIQSLLTNEFQPATRIVEPLVLPQVESMTPVRDEAHVEGVEEVPVKRRVGRPKKVKV